MEKFRSTSYQHCKTIKRSRNHRKFSFEESYVSAFRQTFPNLSDKAIMASVANVNLLGRTDSFKVLNDLTASKQDSIVKYLEAFAATFETD